MTELIYRIKLQIINENLVYEDCVKLCMLANRIEEFDHAKTYQEAVFVILEAIDILER